MFIGGTVKYYADLAGLLLDASFSTDASAPATEVRVKCDGRRAEFTVVLGPFESEPVGLAAAAAAMMRVWGSLIIGVPDTFMSAIPPGRPAFTFEPAPAPGVVHLCAATASGFAAEASVSVTPGPQQMERVKAIAASPSWDPGTSVVFDRYMRALGETDQVAQFLALYEAANLAIETALELDREPGQETLDRELLAVDSTVPLLPPEGRRGGAETPFTRARNQLVHPRDRNLTWGEARAYAAGQLQPFRNLVATLVARSEGIKALG